MKVAFVIQKLAGIRGGAERIAVETAKAMALRGHQVSLVTFEPANGPPGYDPGSVPVSNLFPAFSARRRAIRADRHDGTVRKRRLEAMLKQVPDLFPALPSQMDRDARFLRRRLRGMIRAERPDIVVAVMKPAITAAAFAARGTGTRVIASTHNVMAADYGSAARWDRNPLYLHRSVEAFEHCDAILVLLEEFRDWFPDHLKPRVTVIAEPGCAALRSGSGHPPSESCLGVGRLTRVKRFDLLISA